MIEILFAILFFVITGKILGFALKACWGLTRILFSVFLFPLFLVGVLAAGLLKIAFTVLVILALVTLFKSFVSTL